MACNSLLSLTEEFGNGDFSKSDRLLRVGRHLPLVLETPLELMSFGQVLEVTETIVKQLKSCADAQAAVDFSCVLSFIHLCLPRSLDNLTIELKRLTECLTQIRACLTFGLTGFAVSVLKFTEREILLFMMLHSAPVAKKEWRMASMDTSELSEGDAELVTWQEEKFRQMRSAKTMNFEEFSLPPAVVKDSSAAVPEKSLTQRRAARLTRRLCRLEVADADSLTAFSAGCCRLLASRRTLRSLDAEAAWRLRRACEASVMNSMPLLLDAEGRAVSWQAAASCLRLWRLLADARWLGVPGLQCALQCLAALPLASPPANEESLSDRLIVIGCAAQFAVKAISRFRDYVYSSPALLLSLLTRLLLGLLAILDGNRLVAKDSGSLRVCLSEVNKAATIFCSSEHRKQLAKVTHPLLHCYVTGLHSVVIDNRTREQLDCTVLPFLQLTDRHVMAHLRASLKPGPRELLKHLHAFYVKYHKFHGDV